MTLEGLIAWFNLTHPDIRVVGQNRIAAEEPVSAGNRPDIVMNYASDIAMLARAGLMAPLDEYVQNDQDGFTAGDMQDVFPAYIDRYPRFQNRIYSIGFMRSMEVMYYNADLLREGGFAKPPQTWDEFAQVCASVAKPPEVYCYEMKADATDFVSWVYSRGGDMVSADGRAVAFDQKPGLDALRFLNDLFRKRLAIAASRAFQEPGDFATGKVAFTFDTTLGLGFYDRAVKGTSKPIRWGIAPMPRTLAMPVVNMNGPSLAVLKGAADKQQAAIVFARWLMDREPNAQWVRATGYLPARASTRLRLADYIAANPVLATAYDWLPYGRSEPNVAGWNSVRGLLADAMVAVARGKATPEEALKDAARKAAMEIGD